MVEVAREEALETISRGYVILVIGALWYLVQEGALDLGKAFALFLVLVGAYLIARGSLVRRRGERGTS